MLSLDKYKKHKEERKQEKESKKIEKIKAKQKEKTQLSLTAKKQPKPKAIVKGKSTKKKLLPRKSIIKQLDKITSSIVRIRCSDKK